jgi:hypothetical protein
LVRPAGRFGGDACCPDDPSDEEGDAAAAAGEFFFIFSPNLKQILNLTRLSKKF